MAKYKNPDELFDDVSNLKTELNELKKQINAFFSNPSDSDKSEFDVWFYGEDENENESETVNDNVKNGDKDNDKNEAETETE